MQCLSNSYLRFISLDEILELDTYVFPAPLTPMTTITIPVNIFGFGYGFKYWYTKNEVKYWGREIVIYHRLKAYLIYWIEMQRSEIVYWLWNLNNRESLEKYIDISIISYHMHLDNEIKFKITRIFFGVNVTRFLPNKIIR